MSLRRTVLSLVVTTGVLALSPVAAQAETLRTTDATSDVVAVPDSGAGTPAPVPERAEDDVVSLRVVGGPRTVRATMRLAELTRNPESKVVHSFTFRTDVDRRVGLDLYVADGDWQGDHTWSLAYSDRPCPQLRTRVNYRANTVKVVIPLRCLAHPRWIRTGAGVADLSGSDVYADDAHLTGHVRHNLAFGSRLLLG